MFCDRHRVKPLPGAGFTVIRPQKLFSFFLLKCVLPRVTFTPVVELNSSTPKVPKRKLPIAKPRQRPPSTLLQVELCFSTGVKITVEKIRGFLGIGIYIFTLQVCL